MVVHPVPHCGLSFVIGSTFKIFKKSFHKFTSLAGHGDPQGLKNSKALLDFARASQSSLKKPTNASKAIEDPASDDDLDDAASVSE